MDQIDVFKALYSHVLDHGYDDEIREFAPHSDDTTYFEWMVQTGGYKAVLFSYPFVQSLFDYFELEGIGLLPDENVDGLLRRIMAEQSPLGGFLKAALENPAPISSTDENGTDAEVATDEPVDDEVIPEP